MRLVQSRGQLVKASRNRRRPRRQRTRDGRRRRSGMARRGRRGRDAQDHVTPRHARRRRCGCKNFPLLPETAGTDRGASPFLVEIQPT